MKKTRTEKIITWIAFVVFMLYAITLTYPFIWMAINSLKDNAAFYQDCWGLPKVWMWENYVEALSIKVQGYYLYEVLMNSLIYTFVSASLAVISPLAAAYPCSKYKFKLRGLCMFIIILQISVPSVGSVAATYKILNTFGLYDNWYWGMFISGAGGFSGNFLLIKAALDNTSWTYAEAAFMDGASDLRVMIQIIVPMIKPILIILLIMGLIGGWNEFTGVWMFAPSFPTVAVGTKQLLDNIGSAEGSYPKVFALMLISLVPVMVLFVSFQDTIMNNFTLGGLKG
ncbi:MAG: carbohydrate ABC transporter permease [Clostridiales bacterium]|nr:carbohydrate ABC transporter permease [Clostridiales bacterium]